MFDCYFVCPSGRGDILPCEITHNTFDKRRFKDEGLINLVDSSSSRVAILPAIMCFESLLYLSVQVLEDWTDNHSSFLPLYHHSSIHSHTLVQSSGPFSCSTPQSLIHTAVCSSQCACATLNYRFPSLGIMTTINSIFTNVIKLILCSMRGLFLNSSWYA